MHERIPHLTTLLALSFSESLLLNGITDFIALKWFCYEIKVWIQFTVVLLIIFCNYLTYYRYGKGKEMIISKPSLAGSKTLSIIITWLFFLITASWLFWGPIYGKYLLNQCR
jgi:hypothetical protein